MPLDASVSGAPVDIVLQMPLSLQCLLANFILRSVTAAEREKRTQ
jgi:hypothetical protein